MPMSTASEPQTLAVNTTAPLDASMIAMACLKLHPCLLFVCPF